MTLTLNELIRSVKEKSLSKDDLEYYRDQMSHLFAEMQIELSEIEKQKALFFEEVKNFSRGGLKIIITDIAIRRQWDASEKGQREIVLKRYCIATKELLNSLKSRLYSIY